MLALAIIIIVSLVILFIASFIIYKRMPAPKGTEKLRNENCKDCNIDSCNIRKDE